jgi:hypothetical protein
VRRSAILLKAAALSVNFQNGDGIQNRLLVTFSRYRFTEEYGTNYPLSRDLTQYTDF